MNLNKWLNRDFESSSSLTPEFAEFFKDVKCFVKKELKGDFEFNIHRGHFYFSGFAKNKITNKWAYFSASDVRHFKDGWFNNLLVRTAQNDKDYTGGNNNYSQLAIIKNALQNLTK